MWTLIFFWAIVVLWILRNYLRRRYSYWERRGVDSPKCPYILGNFWETVFFRKAVAQTATDIYNKYQGYNYVGFYKFLKPAILVRNPQLVRDILVKDFQYFQDNDYDVDEKHDILFSRNPFVEKGSRWKVARNHISPNYSSSKVKAMMPLFSENGEKLLSYLNSYCETNSVIDAKDLASRITCENVASCALGLNGGCFAGTNSEFMDMAMRFTNPSFASSLKAMFVFICPPLIHLAKFCKFYIFDGVLTSFFKGMVKECIDYRKREGLQRNDYLDNMNDLRTKIGDEGKFGLVDIAAHVSGFFMDGFETSSIGLSYIIYELSAHPEIQEKLRVEVEEIAKKHGGRITYEAVQEMQYLDCVMKETLRRNVPVSIFMKRCTQSYQLPPMFEDSTGPRPTIEAGTPVTIPVYGLHHDPRLFPDPEAFKPERFAKDEDVVKGSFLPFGEGPRICLGSKFGALQLKVATATIIRDFEVTLNSRTRLPLKMLPSSFFMASVGGLWVNIRKRKI